MGRRRPDRRALPDRPRDRRLHELAGLPDRLANLKGVGGPDQLLLAPLDLSRLGVGYVERDRAVALAAHLESGEPALLLGRMGHPRPSFGRLCRTENLGGAVDRRGCHDPRKAEPGGNTRPRRRRAPRSAASSAAAVTPPTAAAPRLIRCGHRL